MSHARRLALVLLLAAVQVGWLHWFARQALAQAGACEVCDTGYYLASAAAFAREGLLFTNPYDGYRSYFVPLFISAVQHLGWGADLAARYVQGVIVLFCLASAAVMWWVLPRLPARRLLATTLATLANPFLLAYIPFALQEGVLMACCLPLLFAWAALGENARAARALLMVAMGIVAFAVRGSLTWWLLAAVPYAVWQLLRVDPRARRRSVAAAVLVAAVLVGPQVYIAQQKFGSWNPYPTTSVLDQQFAWGVTLVKFATVRDEGHWRGLTYFSPYAQRPDAEKTLGFYFADPAAGIFLAVAHVYAGFHYDQVLPYWRLERAAALTPWLLISSAVVFCGVLGIAAMVRERRFNADGLLAAVLVALNAASLVPIAAEARFGIVGFAMLSLLALGAIGPPRAGRVPWMGLLLYLLLAFAVNVFMLDAADVRL